MQQVPEDGCTGIEMIVDDKPSASFINAISEFLDTDPNDLLLELGYYDRETADAQL